MKNYTGPRCCAGCGKPGSEQSRFSADGLCYPCQDLLSLGRKTRAANEKFADYVTLWVYPFYTADTQQSDLFFRSIKQLCESINDTSKPSIETVSIGHHSSSNSIKITCTRAQYERLKELYNRVQESFGIIFHKGKEEGASLLIGLNNGDLTLAKFDEALKKR